MKVLPQRRRAALLNSVLAVLFVTGAGAAYATVNPSSSSSGTSSTNTTSYTVAKGLVLATASGTGTLYSPSDAGVNFTTGGTITAVDVQAGQKVTKGEVLAKVDPTSANATLAVDEATLTAAQTNLDQIENPSSTTVNGVTTTPTVSASAETQAESQVTSAENAVTAAKAAVAGTVLTAPIAGTVDSVAGQVGGTVSASSGDSSTSAGTEPTGFIVITNPTGMEVTADFAEADALKVAAGQAASVTLNATGTELNAKVLSISSLPVSSSSGSSSGTVDYAALLAITSPTDSLRTGLSATVSVLTGDVDNALYLPTAALTGTGTTRLATEVLADGKTQSVSVKVGLAGDSDVQILSGLTDGEKVQVTTTTTSGFGGFGGRTGGAGGFGGGTGRTGAGGGFTGGGGRG